MTWCRLRQGHGSSQRRQQSPRGSDCANEYLITNHIITPACPSVGGLYREEQHSLIGTFRNGGKKLSELSSEL